MREKKLVEIIARAPFESAKSRYPELRKRRRVGKDSVQRVPAYQHTNR